MRPLATASYIALLSVTAALIIDLVVPSGALAQSDVDAKVSELEADAAQAYGAGEYTTAIGLMVKANQLRPHPNYLLNIAVSYSKIGDCDNATLWGKNAIDSTDPELPPEAKETARSVIAACEESKVVVDPNKGEVDKGDEGTDKKEPEVVAAPVPWLLYTGYGLAGVGGVAILGSLIGDLGIGSDIDELEKLRNAGDTAAADKLQSDIEGSQTLVTVGYVLGFLAAAGGGALIYLDTVGTFAEPTAESGPVTGLRVLPVIRHDGVGLSLGLSF